MQQTFCQYAMNCFQKRDEQFLIRHKCLLVHVEPSLKTA